MTVSGGAFENNIAWGIDLDGDAGSEGFSAGTRIFHPLIANNGAGGGGNLQIRYQEHFTVLGAIIDVPSVPGALYTGSPGSNYNVNIYQCYRANIGGGNWIAASRSTGVAMTNCDSVTVNGGTQINSNAGFGISLDHCVYCIIADSVLSYNANADVVLLNSSGTGNSNAVNNNTMLSTGVTYSVAEMGANHSVITSNRVKGTIILDGASISNSNNTVP